VISKSEAYMAEHGVRAEGGPQDGQWLDTDALPLGARKTDDGWYRLRGKADGSLVYKYEPDLAPLHTQPS
jgi:hypothetical protein